MPKKRLTEEGVKRLKPTAGKQIDYFDQGMPGLILRVSYGDTKTFRVLYYVNKKPKTHKLGRYPVLNLKEAREAARKFLADPQAVLAQAKEGTFESVAADFMRRHVEANKLRSKADIERCLKNYLPPEWKDRIFTEIGRGDVSRLLDRIEDEHGARTADVVLAIIRKMTNWYAARSDNYVSPVVRGMQRTDPSKRARERTLSKEEIRALWKASDMCGTFGAITKIALLTAQRREKIVTMKWADISDSVWIIASEEREKGNAGELRLPPAVLEIIDAQPRVLDNPYVFAAAVGKGPFNSFSQRKEELDAKMLELLPDMPEWRLHDLRRTARTLMSDIEINSETAERILGHRIPGVEGVYNRSRYFEQKARALIELAEHVKKIVNPPQQNVVPITRGKKRKIGHNVA